MALCLGANDALARRRERCREQVLCHSRDYYKDIFMDGGIGLTSRTSLPSTLFLSLSMEYFASASEKSLTAKDTIYQREIFCGSEEDTNGWLLFPDGAPRYRMVYVNGGKAIKHARAMGELGAERIGSFVSNGGSYLGTCAGAYIASVGSYKKGSLQPNGHYWGVWPGYVRATGLRKSSTDILIGRSSPLHRYFNFGKGSVVESVRHNGGCSAYESFVAIYPEGTEVLATYIFDDTQRIQIDGKPSVWAYKASPTSGRVILCGSHPESVKEGKRLEFMSAMVLYAMDGNASPTVKGKLQDGQVREMNLRTEDNNPDYTRIGDRQYHHFTFDVPRNCKSVTVFLEGYKGEDDFDLTLCAKRGERAYQDNTPIKQLSKGCTKSLVIDRPKSGSWYLSVFCQTTVTTTTNRYGTRYKGSTSVLNGVPYKIRIECQ